MGVLYFILGAIARRWYGGMFPDEEYKILGNRGVQIGKGWGNRVNRVKQFIKDLILFIYNALLISFLRLVRGGIINS